jgi:hypothetical protein
MKRKNLLAVLVLAVMLSLVLAVTAAAGDCGCPPPPPPPCADGCTPGYWKQPHHFDSWVGYSPDDSFDAIFGTSYDITMLEALKSRLPKGEGELIRHAAAAVLNASNPDVNYMWDLDTIKAAFAAGNAGALVMANEKGCPLN